MNLKPDAPIFDRMKELHSLTSIYMLLYEEQDKSKRIELRNKIRVKLDELQTELDQ